jgi:hypothetical protein
LREREGPAKREGEGTLLHVWTAPGAQGVLFDLAHGTSAVMCPAFDAAA